MQERFIETIKKTNPYFYIIIIALACIARIYWSTIGLSPDDYYVLEMANMSDLKALYLRYFEDNNPIGLYLIYHYLLKLINPTHLSLIIIPLIFGILSLFEFKKLNSLIISHPISQKISYILFSLSFGVSYYSSEVRSYIIVIYLTILLTRLLIELKELNLKNGFKISLLAFVSISLHYTAIPLIAALYIAYFLEHRSKATFKFLFFSTLAIVVAYSYEIKHLLRRVVEIKGIQWVEEIPKDLEYSLNFINFFFNHWAVLVIILILLFINITKFKYILNKDINVIWKALILSGFINLVISAKVNSLFLSRYFLIYFPFFVISISYFIFKIQKFEIWIIGTLSLFLLGTQFDQEKYFKHRRDRYNKTIKYILSLEHQPALICLFTFECTALQHEFKLRNVNYFDLIYLPYNMLDSRYEGYSQKISKEKITTLYIMSPYYNDTKLISNIDKLTRPINKEPILHSRKIISDRVLYTYKFVEAK